MLNISFLRTQTARTGDSHRAIKSMSYNVPGHAGRVKAHCKRVQEEYFNSGLFYKEMHNAQGGSIR